MAHSFRALQNRNAMGAGSLAEFDELGGRHTLFACDFVYLPGFRGVRTRLLQQLGVSFQESGGFEANSVYTTRIPARGRFEAWGDSNTIMI